MFVSRTLNWTIGAVLCLTSTAASVGFVQAQGGRQSAAQEEARSGERPDDGHYVNDRPLEPLDGKGGSDISGPYEVVRGWPQPLHDDGWHTRSAAGVYAESPDRVYVAATGEIPRGHLNPHAWGPDALVEYVPTYVEALLKVSRREHILLVFDRQGRLIESWEQWNSLIKSPHRIHGSPYDPGRHVWLADQSANQVFKFTRDGKTLAMAVGDKDVPRTDPQVRFSVQDIAWLPNGDFYVAGGGRVVKFSKDGKYVSEFGRPGKGPGEFQGLHSMAVDHARGRLYLADRANSRVQVFDLNGTFIDQWPNILGPFCVRLTKDGRYLWVSDGYTQKFLKFDAMTGKLLTSFGTLGTAPGAFLGIHYFDTDSEGNLYVAEDFNGRVQKLQPRKDGNPEQLLGQLMR